MSVIRLAAVAAVVCLLGATAAADDKKADNAKLILGKWEVVSAHEGGPPKGGLVEYTKDGKLKVVGEVNGMKQEFDGTYKLDGNKLVLTFKIEGNDVTVNLTIDKLDENTCVTTSNLGKVELKRKK